ncbi:unnamed protein product [Allacma fusca]|uniref:Uncharacterized protein n=1 Tax=Allacma fusca TaxID=39272 RepID=A0A8J2J3L8_9HEXA|nr:unnamed protein product [Allacma fusca]
MSTHPQLSTRAFDNPRLIVVPDVSTFSLELVLNSLDVGATEISVDIDPRTHDITVRDNGFGMNFTELQRFGYRSINNKGEMHNIRNYQTTPKTPAYNGIFKLCRIKPQNNPANTLSTIFYFNRTSHDLVLA